MCACVRACMSECDAVSFCGYGLIPNECLEALGLSGNRLEASAGEIRFVGALEIRDVKH